MEHPFTVITGMHRSGTSLVAHVLREMGLWMGEETEMSAPSDANLKGYWEHHAISHHLDEMLLESGGSWLMEPEKWDYDLGRNLCLSHLTWKLHQNYEDKPAGFKDPRVCLTHSKITDDLPKPLFVVGCYRHPLKVAESLRTRDGMPYEVALACWGKYNRKLLEMLEIYPFRLINFDWHRERLFTELRGIGDFLGLDYKLDIGKIYSEDLKRSDRTFDESVAYSNAIESIYDRLQEKTERR